MPKKPSRFNGNHSAILVTTGVVCLFVVAGGVLSYSVLPQFTATVYERSGEVIGGVFVSDEKKDTEKKSTVTLRPGVTHIHSREPLYAIYMSQCVVGTPTFRNSLVKLIEETSLNAVVIDIKDYTGKIAFPTTHPLLEDSVSDACGARDMEAFIKLLHEKDIYVIGRITVFQDPYYTSKHPELAVQSIKNGGPWKDYKGLAFIDVSSREYWDYVVALSEESYAIGFDELNYDYVRYPSDGPMSDASYKNQNKPEALEQFFKYLHEHVAPIGVVMSADLFGMTTTNTDDLNIGQVLERALPYFDYIAPMVYPSHYPKGFLNLENPNNDPYLVVNHAMKEAVRRTEATSTRVQTLDGKPIMETVTVPATATTATTTKEVPTGLYTKEAYSKLKIRPWLQDFDYGKDYKPADIDAQIRATYDAGLTSWFFWDPANRYENLKAVLSE